MIVILFPDDFLGDPGDNPIFEKIPMIKLDTLAKSDTVIFRPAKDSKYEYVMKAQNGKHGWRKRPEKFNV